MAPEQVGRLCGVGRTFATASIRASFIENRNLAPRIPFGKKYAALDETAALPEKPEVLEVRFPASRFESRYVPVLRIRPAIRILRLLLVTCCGKNGEHNFLSPPSPRVDIKKREICKFWTAEFSWCPVLRRRQEGIGSR